MFFLIVFAFADYGDLNMNYIYPYSTETTHGIVLSFAAIAGFWKWLQPGRLAFLAVTGACVGLVFLTKAEVFLALAAALFVGLVLATWLQSTLSEALIAWGTFSVSFCVPLTVACLLFSLEMPFSHALHATGGAFAYVFNERITTTPFYRNLMGTQSVSASLTAMGSWTAIYAAAISGATVIAFLVRGSRNLCRAAALAAALILAAAIACYYMSVCRNWLRPLPIVLAIAGCATLCRLWNWRDQPAKIREPLLELVVIVFSFSLLFKVILNVRVYSYGFALAMPGTLVLLVILWERIPSAIRRSSGSPLVFEGACLGWSLALMVSFLYQSQLHFNAKSYSVAGGANWIKCEPAVGRAVDAMLREISTHTTPEQSLIAMPEGTMINFLARRSNRVPYLNYNPTEVHLYGEDRMLAALEAHPPDFLFWAPRDYSEFGVQRLGTGYGEKLAAWLTNHYELMASTRQDGSSPLMQLARYRKNSNEK
jgi:hypothetical protein